MEEIGVLEEMPVIKGKEKKKAVNKTEKNEKSDVKPPKKGETNIQLHEVSLEMEKILRELQGSLGKFPDVSHDKKTGLKKDNKIKTVMPVKNKCVDNIQPHQEQTLKSKCAAKNYESLLFYHKPNCKSPDNYVVNKIMYATHSKKPTPSPNHHVPSLHMPLSVSSIRSGSSRGFTSYPKRETCRALSSIQSMLGSQNEVFRKLKYKVEQAIRERKTFTVCGNFYTIRRSLLARGWIEKMRNPFNSFERDPIRRLLLLPIVDLLAGVNDPKTGNSHKRAIMSKLLSTHQVDFYWDQYNDCFRVCPDDVKLTIVNRFKKGIFHYTSKQGLCEAMKSAYWFQRPGISLVRYPRTYNLANVEDPKDFINDFKLTACMALIKFIVFHIEAKRGKNILSDDGKVPINTFHFAIQELKKAIRKFNHEDIDSEIQEAKTNEWNNFLENFYRVVHIGLQFKTDGTTTLKKMLDISNPLIQQLNSFWPAFNIDGMLNIWILKPVNSCRGQGIHLCRTLQYILKIIRLSSTKKYIIQKYIEKPLLIHETKFDIRQWFLISSANPLTIWIYKDCYVRFSSQIYCLKRLNESIHLTNNSIQCKYKNCNNRHCELPACNMWDTRQFKDYLRSIGQPNVFEEIIYPGMKEAITAAIIINQDALDTRRNCFELYGSDFMITEDFRPWLIEINSRPALFASTPVTGRMCPQVLEDLIKVIIDYARNCHSSTGRFELLYKEAHCVLPPIKTAKLQLQGRKLAPNYFCNSEDRYQRNKSFYMSQEKFKGAANDIKDALQTLLLFVQSECSKKNISNYTSVGINTSESECSIKKLSNLNDDVDFLQIKCSKSRPSKSETDIKKCSTISAVSNRSIFENFIQSMKNLAKAYQEYKSSYKSIK